MEELKELKKKGEKELQKLLEESRDKLRDMRFKVSQRQLKKVRDLRKMKRQVARFLTILNEKKPASAKASAGEQNNGATKKDN